jgi:hypothetical protein
MPSHGFAREAFLILTSAILGYAAAQFGARRQDVELAREALRGLQEEAEYNLAVLEPFVPMHDQWVSAMEAPALGEAGQSGIDVFFATRPPLPAAAQSPFPVLRRSAWDAALAAGALRLIAFDTGAALSDIYRAQEILTDNVNRLAEGALSQVAVYDPSSRAASVRLLWLTLADIAAAETELLKLYQEHVPLWEGVPSR